MSRDRELTATRRAPGVARSSLTGALGTSAARLTGLVRILTLAAVLGIGPLAEAYNLANTTPNIVYNLVAGGVLAEAVVPVFIERLAFATPERAARDLSAVVSVAVVLLLGATVAFVALAPVVIDLYNLGVHGPAARLQAREATFLLRLFAPQLLLYGLIDLVMAVLYARRRFAAAAFSPAANNLVVVAVLLLALALAPHPTLAYAATHPAYGLLLGLGTTAGVGVQLLVLLPSFSRCGVHLRWHFDPRNAAVRKVVRLSGWTFGFVLANQAALFVVLALAQSTRPADGVAAWTYAYAFFQLPFGVVAVSIMNAVQPELAERFAAGNRRGFRRRLGSGLRATLGFVLPAAIGLGLLARPLVLVLLDHGNASRAGTLDTASLLVSLASSLPGFSAFLYLARAWQAMQDTRTLFFLYLFENALNVVLALALVVPFGLVGLGLSYAGAYSAAAVASAIVLARRGYGPSAAELGRLVARTVPPAVAFALVVAGLRELDLGAGDVGLFAELVLAGAGGVTVYVLVAAAGAAMSQRGGAGGRRRGGHRQWS